MQDLVWQLAHKAKQLNLTADNLMAVITKMTTLKADDGGAFINVRPTTLLVPPSLEKAALDICNADVINGDQHLKRSLTGDGVPLHHPVTIFPACRREL